MKKTALFLLGTTLAVVGATTGLGALDSPSSVKASVEENLPDVIEEQTYENEENAAEFIDETEAESEENAEQQTDESVVPQKRRHIVVFGGGKVSAVPDVAYVTIGVESINSDLNSATTQNNEALENIIDYLKENHISEDNIKTKYYSIYQRHDFSSSEKFSEYQVSSGLEIKFSDLDNLSTYISDMTELGANNLGCISFDCENASSYYQEALKLALEDAKNKATALVDDDLTICGICEECVYTCLPYRISDAKMLTNGNTLLKGNMDVEAKIKVIFK